MKKFLLSLAVALPLVANAELIQHTDQIAEVRFTGSSYELGYHVGTEGKEQILDAIDRFNDTLGIMLPGLNVISLAKSFDGNQVFLHLSKTSPDAAAYISGMADALNQSPNLLLAVAMSDEAILESQRNGGLGFLQTEATGHNPAAPSKCTTFGYSNEAGHAWAGANFDYMGINYEGLIVLNHTDLNGDTRVIQTWAGLIPYGGISKGGQAILMNTMADEGTAREQAGQDIIQVDAVPSFYLSWEAYNASNAADLISSFQAHDKYTAFFSYTVVDSKAKVMNIENNFGGAINYRYASKLAHANHSVFIEKPFVNSDFAAHSLARQDSAERFIKSANASTSQAAVRQQLESKPLWKGRGKLMGTVTSTYFTISPSETVMHIKTDNNHPVVSISNR
ncbi:C45 family autoproteolytic acyltransferase/hydolase [Agarivorans sp. JK6]|uniref:C45 family autoproteolytic acyltransferase/hydolase n=1 Tax=Agarivorans sp. JK6 TaxID=2997426 RepID=UPI0038734CF1